jgi:hypothetical protein
MRRTAEGAEVAFMVLPEGASKYNQPGVKLWADVDSDLREPPIASSRSSNLLRASASPYLPNQRREQAEERH